MTLRAGLQVRVWPVMMEASYKKETVLRCDSIWRTVRRGTWICHEDSGLCEQQYTRMVQHVGCGVKPFLDSSLYTLHFKGAGMLL